MKSIDKIKELELAKRLLVQKDKCNEVYSYIMACSAYGETYCPATCSYATKIRRGEKIE